MKPRALCLALAAACLPAAAGAAGQPAYFAVRYACEDGRQIRVAYPVDHLAGHPITLRFIGRDGGRVTMRPAVSASGARYENRGRRLEWFTKGDQGLLIDTAADRSVHCELAKP